MTWKSFEERKKKALAKGEKDEWGQRKKEAVFIATEKYAKEFDLDPDELLRSFISWDSFRNPIPPEEVDEYMRERAEAILED